MFVSPQNSHVVILTLNTMALGGGAFRRGLGHEGAALRKGMSALIKGTSPVLFLPCEETMRRWQTATKKRVLIRTPPCRHPDLGLPGSRL